MNKNNTFKLGRSIVQVLPFHKPIKEQQLKQQKEIFTTKLVITIVIISIAIVKIAVLMLWI